jgi:hypothetical protein
MKLFIFNEWHWIFVLNDEVNENCEVLRLGKEFSFTN